MTVLITGASGNIGGGVARELAAAGRPVVLAGRDPRSISAPSGSASSVRRLDYDDPASYAGALDGATSALLVAPPVDSRARERMTPFIRAMAEADVAHAVVVSAVMAETDENFSLRGVERVVEDSGLRWTHLRCQWYMNSLTIGVFAPMAAGGEIKLPAGDGRVAFVDPRDVAAAAATVLGEPSRHEGTAYALTGPEALAWPAVAEMCSAYFARPIRYRPISDDQYRDVCRSTGLPGDVAEFLIDLYAAIRDGRAARTTHDVRRLTGRQPCGLREFLSRAAEDRNDAESRRADAVGDGR
jgi:uncharacterized protein YbjT (DUF2867 family)